jgi:DNA mismatch endonuclease, patch repair protein
MADIVPPDVRSRMMRGIRGTNTKPELLLRKGLHSKGFRYRLHARELPGRPDIVLPRYRATIFAHGCFWHKHDCHLFKWPKTRSEFWLNKLIGNRAGDVAALKALGASGWRQAIVWECALKGKARRPLTEVVDTCARWITSNQPFLEIQGISTSCHDLAGELTSFRVIDPSLM